MTPTYPPAPGTSPVPDGNGDGSAVAGLAREVDALRRALAATAAELGGLPRRVDDLDRLLAQLAETVAAFTSRPGPVPAPSWLLAPTDPDTLAALVGELVAWLRAVFLRYPDGVSVLPECWIRHPEVVEELLWLMHAWCHAYQGRAASVHLAADWHDRLRPGVIRRLRVSAGSCSIERHQTRPGWDQHPSGAVSVPGTSDSNEVTELTEWWATRRDDPAPEPPQSVATQTGAGNGTRNGRDYR